MYKLFIVLCLFINTEAFARTRADQPLPDTLAPAEMSADNLYYKYEMLDYKDWAAKSPAESQDLMLYPGYKEPDITTIKNGVKKKVQTRLKIFTSSAKLILNKAPAQLNLKQLMQIETIRQFDREIQHAEIKPNQFMSAVVGRTPFTNFQWGNCQGNVMRPARELDLAHINPLNRSWCSDAHRSICLESCYSFNEFWRQGLRTANIMANFSSNEDARKDTGVGLQSEVRYFESEQELSLPVALKTLTKVDTPIRGGLEQSIFYWNQLFQYGKVIAVFQAMPGDSSKTLMTAFFVVGLKKSSYDTYNKLGLGAVLEGKSRLIRPTATGITAGLPTFSKDMIRAIADVLEN